MTGSGDEGGDLEGPEVYLTKGMVDEEEIQDARYDVLRPSLLDDPELDLSCPPFLDLIQTRPWNHWYQRGRKHFTHIPKTLPANADTLWDHKIEGSQSWYDALRTGDWGAAIGESDL